jgi:hypothetical protein
MKQVSTKIQSMVLVCALGILTQGCGNKFEVLNPTSNATPIIQPAPSNTTDTALRSRATAIRWTSTSGPTSPAETYTLEYEIDFLGKTRTIKVKTNLNPTVVLPIAGTKNLTDLQIEKIRLLISQIRFEPCYPGDGIFAGGIRGSKLDLVEIMTSSLTQPEQSLYGVNCFGLSLEGQSQAVSGYKELSDYLSTL